MSAGNLSSPPGPPETTLSYSLEDIYNRLDTGTSGISSSFSEPTHGPPTNTMHSINDIMGIAPALDASHGVSRGYVLTGTTFWGLTSSTWGLQTGTMPNNEAITITPTTTNQTITAGYHNGSGAVLGDADLIAENIRSGVNIFGVAGNPNIVNTSSGNATSSDILTGQVAWVDGAEVTGNRYPAPVPQTGQTTSYASGDDGEREKGIPWEPSTRYITGTTGTTGVTVVVTDTLTGLVWLQDANCIANEYPSFDTDGHVAWHQALSFVEGITVTGTYSNCSAGFSDWRLPNVQELQSVIDYGRTNPALPSGHPFTNVYSGGYWSSSTDHAATVMGWYVDLSYGQVNYANKSSSGSEYAVWPVRGGQP